MLLVKQMLEPKKLEKLVLYKQSINLDAEFHSATARTVEEVRKLIEEGFDHVTDLDGIKLFRKRK